MTDETQTKCVVAAGSRAGRRLESLGQIVSIEDDAFAFQIDGCLLPGGGKAFHISALR